MENLFVFRYPGGKSKFGKKIIPYFPKEIKNYYEPFVGGGGMFLNMLLLHPNANFFINDLDEEIYSFWKVVCEGSEEQFNQLIEKINIHPTIEYFNQLKKEIPETIIDKAYYGFFFNKTTFSGIRNGTPIGGLDQKGKWKIDCRYNKEKIIRKIKKIRELSNRRVIVTNLHFREFLKSSNGFIYLDPPYFKVGNSLYRVGMSEEEHKEMYLILNSKSNWFCSYDDDEYIKLLYKNKKILEIENRSYMPSDKVEAKKKKEILIYD